MQWGNKERMHKSVKLLINKSGSAKISVIFTIQNLFPMPVIYHTQISIDIAEQFMKREITRSQKVKLSTFIPVLKAKGAKITLMKPTHTILS